MSMSLYDKIHQELLTMFNVLELKDIPKDKQQLAVKVVIFKLTNSFLTQYGCGLQEKMFLPNFDYTSNFKWIFNNWNNRVPETPTFKARFNMSFIDQRNPNHIHRSGWQDVYNALEPYNNSQILPLLDLSIDRTFLWESDIMSILGMIPYTTNWYGFIHHTFDTTFSNNNCVELFKKDLFKKSLPSCKGIFVLSDTLGQSIKKALLNIGFGNINVVTTFHPTEIQCASFNYNLYSNNQTKQLVHIGGWLRNTNTFYKLQLQDNIEKLLLVGNVDIPNNTCNGGCNGTASNTCNGTVSNTCNGTVSNTHCSSICYCCNRFHKNLEKDLKKLISSVTLIQRKPDLEYDDFLKDKVVFLHLIDASACNTVIECIARCTPIILNRLPALEEYLGIDYPLFYPNNATQFEITTFTRLAFENNTIRKAHVYLLYKSKEKLIMSEFVRKVLNTIAG